MTSSALSGGFAVAASVLFLSTSAFANGITGWSCEAGASAQTLTLTTSGTMSNSATVNINDTAQTGATEVNGNSISVSISSDIACWNSTFTITDGGDTFGSD
jgi:hypothetical protein